MKIARAQVYGVDLPYTGGVYRLSGGREFRSFRSLVVRLETDTGLVGWGESCPFGGTYIAAHAGDVLAALEELSPVVLGLDPRQYDRVYDAMDAVLLGQLSTKAAIDIACWDLAGKAAGVPICDLLGGRVADEVAAISSIGTDNPEVMRASVQRHRDQGFRAHSIKVGASEDEGGPSLDAARITAVLADRQPGEWFLADCNNGLSVEHALRLFELLPKGLDFVLEAPCATWRETLAVRAKCPYPIMLDELVQSDADVVEAIAQNACDGINLKLSKQGGLTRCRAQRDMARAAGMTVSVQDTWGSDISRAAIQHLACSTPKGMVRFALDTRPLVGTSLGEIDSFGPGLGIEPDPSKLGQPLIDFAR